MHAGLTLSVTLVASTVTVYVGTAGAAVGDERTWGIGNRTLPAPAAASDALRGAIESSPIPDVAESRKRVPAGESEWLALIAQQRSQASIQARAMAERLEVSVHADQLAGVDVHHLAPRRVVPHHARHLFVYVHGGGYVFGAGDSGIMEAALIAGRLKMRVLSIDYRMPPEDSFPAAVDDVIAVYRHLLSTRSAKSMAMGGTSAGGGLTLATVHKLIALNLKVPGAVYAGTPWADLTKTGDTLFSIEGIDRVLVTYDGILRGAARLYAGEHDLKNPLISPVYGDFNGFPPAYLVTGTRDLFLSDTARTHRKLRVAGVPAELNVYEGFAHGDYLFVTDSPESRQVYSELDAFLLMHLD